MSQTSTRVGWNGGLGGWEADGCRGFMDFALFIHSAQSQHSGFRIFAGVGGSLLDEKNFFLVRLNQQQ